MPPNAHQTRGSVCTASQSARGPTHGDPPLPDLCVFFQFVSLQFSWLHDLLFVPDYQASVFWQDAPHLNVYCSITIQIKTTARLGLLECKKKRPSNTESCMCAYISSEQTRLTCFLSRNTFVRCLRQHPEATFSSWVPPPLTQASLLLCFLQPRLRDALSSILLIQGCQNEECEGICEYHLWSLNHSSRFWPLSALFGFWDILPWAAVCYFYTGILNACCERECNTSPTDRI